MDSVRRTEIAVIQIPYVMDNVVFHILLEWVPLRTISKDWGVGSSYYRDAVDKD
jgi:hypothetical protein